MTTVQPSTIEQGITITEDFRNTMRSLGQSTPAVEKFANEVIALIIVSGSPKAAIEAAIRNLGHGETGVSA